MFVRYLHHLLVIATLGLVGCSGFGLEPFNDGSDSPQLLVQPAEELVFGALPAGSGTAQGELVLAGTGESVVIVQSIEIVGGDASAFGLPDLNTPRAIRPGATFTVNVSFRPPRVGALVSEVVITAVNVDIEISRMLRGTGCNDANNDGQCDQQGPPPVETDLDSGW